MRRNGVSAFALGLALALVLLIAPAVSTGAGGDTLLPATKSLDVAPGYTADYDSTLHLDAAPPKADVLLMFDTTGSMGGAIADAQNDAGSIVSRLKASIPNVRFGIADFRDYPISPFGGSAAPPNDDYPWKLDESFTADSTTIQNAINGLAACSGCGSDLPEAYNRAFYEASRLDWAPNTPRFIVVLGDSYGHDPNQGVDFGGAPNCTPTAQADPGPDGVPGNADDLGTLGTLTTLKNASTNVSFVTYNPGAAPANNVECQTAMARFTGGNEVVHGGGDSLSNQIVGLVNQAAAKVDQVTFQTTQTSGPGEAGSGWFDFSPRTLGPLVTPRDVSYTTLVSPPAGASPGTYTFQVSAVADGLPRGNVQTVTVRVLDTAAAQNAVADVHLSVDEPALPAGVALAPFSKIPASRIPFFTGASTDTSTPYGSTPYGSTPFGSTPFGSTPYGSTPFGSTPYGSTPYGSTPYGSTPFGSTPWGSTPFGSTPFGSTPYGSTTGVLGAAPFGSTPFGSTAYDHVLLSQLPLLNPADHATWPEVLAGTPLAGQPLSSLSLADVLNNDTAKARLYQLPMKDISFASSLWQDVPVGAILLGQLKVSDVPVPQSLQDQTGANTWQGVIAASGGCASCIGNDNTFFGIAAAGALGDTHIGSIPFGSTPFGSTPYGSTPYGSTPGGAITLNSMNIAGTRLAAVPLTNIRPLADIVDCAGTGTASTFDCTGKTLGDAAAAHAVKAAATLATLFTDLDASDPAHQMTLDEIVGAVLPFTSYPWEQLPVQGLQDVAGTGKNAHYHVTFALACGTTSDFRVDVRLPNGFFPVPGTSKFTFGGTAAAVGDPQLTTVRGGEGEKPSTVARWLAPASACNGATGTQAVQLGFAAFTGLQLGTQTSQATVTAAGVGHVAPENAPVLVTQNQEPNDDPATAPTITSDELVVGHVASSGDGEYFRFPLTGLPVNSRVVAFLKVPSGADFDLTLNGPSLPAVQSTPFGSTPLGTTPVPDQPVGTDNSQTVPQANTLSDVPFGSTPWGSTPFGSTAAGGISQNRGDASEQTALVVHSATSGMATIGVTGYNGSFSDMPYVLRLEVLPPPPLPATCPARTGYDDATQIGPLPAPTSLPQSTKTLFLVDRQRFAKLYGSTAASTIVAPASAGGAVGTNLAALAARSEVGGAVLSVDGNAAVRTAYSGWDASPCSPDAANGVVRAINDLVATYRNALPNLHNIVLLGTDTAVPMYRQPDPTILSPELDEASDLAFTTNGLTTGNSLYAAVATNNILTDGAYGAFNRITWLDHDLPLPQLPVARLVESPSDINSQLSQYLSTNGTLQPGTLSPNSAVTTGYDFLADSATATNTAFGDTQRLPGVTRQALITPMHATTGLWTKTDVDNTFFSPVGGVVPDIGALYGHYNHYAFKPAGPATVTDIATQVATATGEALGKANLGRHIIFTVGCHGGLNVGDELGLSPTSSTDIKLQYQDWAQTYMQDQVAAYVANTGFGYGDTDSIAASEKLYKLFAENLNKGSSTIGDNWFNALTSYYLGSSIYSAYDEKVMLEATFYGLPFWHFGSTPAPADGSAVSSTTPSGTIDVAPTSITGLASTAPSTPGEGATQYWQGPAGTLAVPYRPIQPLARQDVSVAGKQARDIFVTALQTVDVNDPNPTQASPVVNASKNEPSKNFADAYWPASFTALQRMPRFGQSERDMAVVTLGQYRPDAQKERLVNSIGFQVTYSTATDVTRPLISEVGAIQASGGTSATIFIRGSDNSGSLKRIGALWNDGSGNWQFTDQVANPAPGLYTATVSVPSGNRIEVAGELMDNAGNVAQAWNKAFNYQSSPDTDKPSITIDNPLPGAVYTLNQQVKLNFSCSDADGFASGCTATPLVNGNLDTSTVGPHTLTVTATDLSGNPTYQTVPYTVVYSFDGFRQPVDNQPTLNVAQAGKTIPVKWALLDAAGAAVSDLGAITAVTIQSEVCPTAATDAIETTVAAGLSGLTYDTAGKQFIFNWQTSKGWSGTCKRLTVTLGDGSSPRSADFQFK